MGGRPEERKEKEIFSLCQQTIQGCREGEGGIFPLFFLLQDGCHKVKNGENARCIRTEVNSNYLSASVFGSKGFLETMLFTDPFITKLGVVSFCIKKKEKKTQCQTAH